MQLVKITYRSIDTRNNMPPTNIRGQQILNGTVARADLNVSTTGSAVVARILQGTGITLSSTGADTGTGDVTISGSPITPGAWANVTLQTGWTAPIQAQYRIEVNGAVSTVYFRGMIQAAYSALGAAAFTVPSGAYPSMTRSAVLGGAQNTGTATDVASYIASMSTTGSCTVYVLGAGPFCWFDPSQTQLVYLDGLSYSL